MITILSPAKSLSFEDRAKVQGHSTPELLRDTKKIMQVLKKKSPGKLKKLMGLSDDLAQLNYERNQAWEDGHNLENAKQAVFAFTGDVYRGLDATTMKQTEVEYAQDHLRILSGLYGLLKPLDLIQPYRLEMGTSIKNTRGKDLYGFWGDRITKQLNQAIAQSGSYVLLNLASNEYFKAVNTKKTKAQIVTPKFLDYKNGKYKTIMVYAKQARGSMARFVIKNKISSPEGLVAFDVDGYLYNAEMSNEQKLVFTRKR